MIKERVRDALNKQVNWELHSSYLYLSMNAYFASINLKGFANWMRVQAQEELVHAMKFYDFIIQRGGGVTLSAIEEPLSQWASPLDAFQEVYKHEQRVTGLIQGLVDLSISEQDHATSNFLQWFVTEQVEEEASAHEIVQKLIFVSDTPYALFVLDNELGQRVFTPPAASEKGGG